MLVAIRANSSNTSNNFEKESKCLYEEYKKQYASDSFDNGTIETGKVLINNMKEEKKKRWEEVIISKIFSTTTPHLSLHV